MAHDHRDNFLLHLLLHDLRKTFLYVFAHTPVQLVLLLGQVGKLVLDFLKFLSKFLVFLCELRKVVDHLILQVLLSLRLLFRLRRLQLADGNIC